MAGFGMDRGLCTANSVCNVRFPLKADTMNGFALPLRSAVMTTCPKKCPVEKDGPDDDGCEWICSAIGRHDWC